uniref:MADF domain-containing protein n=1 Tax=Haemonchus contortus TaxID=6289 RepID=A0A7I5E581_HAECO|nr:MADF domain containing protein [Haemonchus contortus]
MASTAVSAAGNAAVMTKPPPIVEGHNLQTLHPADQQWVGTHQPSPAQPVQRNETLQLQHHGGSMITDEIRFSIIDAVYLRPGIWDCQREKTVGPSRKELFVEVTNLINQQNQLDPELTPEEVEKQWKNLKDTYVKTRKKLSYNNDSMPVTPKWKFYSSLMFLDDLFSVHSRNISKRRIDDVTGPSQTSMVSAKRIPPPPSEDAEDEDEYMAFCRSLLHPLREIAYKDRIQYLKVQKAIRDLLHDAQMDMLLTHMR